MTRYYSLKSSGQLGSSLYSSERYTWSAVFSLYGLYDLLNLPSANSSQSSLKTGGLRRRVACTYTSIVRTAVYISSTIMSPRTWMGFTQNAKGRESRTTMSKATTTIEKKLRAQNIFLSYYLLLLRHAAIIIQQHTHVRTEHNINIHTHAYNSTHTHFAYNPPTPPRLHTLLLLLVLF